MIYIFLVVWLVMAAVICFGFHLHFDKNRYLYLKFIVIPLILVMGFRNYTVGVDTASYMHYYEIISDATFKEILSGWMYSSMEVGYCLLLKVSSLFVDNYYFFQILQAIIFNVLIMYFIRENTQNYFLAYSVFLGMGMYTLSFNITRQMIAVAIITNAWTLISKGRKFQALILLFIAVSIHTSSIIFLAAYFVYMCRYSQKLLRVMPILIIIIGINYRSMLGFAQMHISRFNNYYSNLKDKMDAGFVKIIWLIIVVLSCFIIYRREKVKMGTLRQEKFDALCVRAELAGIFSISYIVTQIIGMHFNYFERVGLFFEPFVIIVFEEFGKRIVSKAIRQFYYCALCFFFIMYFLFGCLTSAQYQYSFFFI